MIVRSVSFALVIAGLLATTASADPISIFHTGQGLNPGDNDPNWGVYQTQSSIPDSEAFVGGSTTFPGGPLGPFSPAGVITPHPAWAPAPAGASWVGFRNPQDVDGSEWLFRTTFDLTGLDPSTAMLSGEFLVDNAAVIFLNGQLVDSRLMAGPGDASPFQGPTSFLVNSGFLPGVNTLDFLVRNLGWSGENPLGLAVSVSGSADASPVPEPTTMALWGALGLAGLAFRRRFSA